MIFASQSCTFDCLVCLPRNRSWTEVQLLPSINRSGVLSAISALWKRTLVGASEQVRRTPVDHRNKRQEGTGSGAVTRVAWSANSSKHIWGQVSYRRANQRSGTDD